MEHEFDDKWLMQYKLPQGDLGRQVGNEMNESHFNLWHWALEKISLPPEGLILDIGCGGGGALKLMGDICSEKVHFIGADLSEDMVKMTAETCSEMIKSKRLATKKCDVNALPFANSSFVMTTAFEVIYFWEDLPQALNEIKRTLLPGGKFLVVNEMSDTGEKMCEIHQRAHDLLNMYIPKPSELKEHLILAEFENVKLFEHPDKPWIVVCGQKAEE